MIVWTFLLWKMSLIITVNLQIIYCPRERGIYFATSPDCIIYYRCENRFFSTQVCFPWQRFDIHTLRCRRRTEVDCNPMYAGIWRPLFGDRPGSEGGEIVGGEIGIGGGTLGEVTGENPSEQNVEIAGESPFGQETPGESENTGEEETGIAEESLSVGGNSEIAGEISSSGQENVEETETTGEGETGPADKLSSIEENSEIAGESRSPGQETPEETGTTKGEEAGTAGESPSGEVNSEIVGEINSSGQENPEGTGITKEEEAGAGEESPLGEGSYKIAGETNLSAQKNPEETVTTGEGETGTTEESSSVGESSEIAEESSSPGQEIPEETGTTKEVEAATAEESPTVEGNSEIAGESSSSGQENPEETGTTGEEEGRIAEESPPIVENPTNHRPEQIAETREKDDTNSETEQHESIQEMLTKNDASEYGNPIKKTENLETLRISDQRESENPPLSAIQTQNKEQILANNHSDAREIIQPTEESIRNEKENSGNKEPVEIVETTDNESSSSTTEYGSPEENLSENVIVSEETSGPEVPATLMEVKSPLADSIEFDVQSPTLEETFQANSSVGEKSPNTRPTIGENTVTPEEKTDVEEKTSSTAVKNMMGKDPSEGKNSQEEISKAEKRSVEKVPSGEDSDDKIIIPDSDSSAQNWPNEVENSNGELSLRASISLNDHSSAGESLPRNTKSAQSTQDTGSTGKIWYWCGSGRLVLAQKSEGDSVCLQLQDPESINAEGNVQAGGDGEGHTFLGSNDEFA